jgi:phosphohistidine phosphatase
VSTRLYVLRHAEAEGAMGGPDHERALTPAGVESARASAAVLARLGLRFERGVTSPAVRAAATADIFWKVLGAGELSREASLAPGADPDPVITLLRSLSSRIEKPMRLLVVGHMPDLAALLQRLANGRVLASLSFPPGGMSRLDFDAEVRAGEGTLVWSYRPAELSALRDARQV